MTGDGERRRRPAGPGTAVTTARRLASCCLVLGLAACSAETAETILPLVRSSLPDAAGSPDGAPLDRPPAFAYRTPTPPARPAAYVEEGKAYALSRQDDPGSARFRNVRYNVGSNARNDRVYAVCGEISVRNALGLYQAYRPFVYENRENGVLFVMPGDGVADDVFQSVYANSCDGVQQAGNAP